MAKNKAPKKEYKKVFLLMAVGIIAIVFIIAFFILLQSNSNKIHPTLSLPTETPYPTRSQPDYYDFFKYKLTSKPNLSQTTDWATYINPEFGFEFKYPSSWRISSDSYVFPQRDLVTVIGDEAYEDDAYFSVANPTGSSKNIDNWYNYRYRLITPAPEALETEIINGVEFKKKFTAGEVCQTYYYLSKSGYIFEFALSTFCDEKSKEQSDQTLVNIINTLKFSN